jgi:hypothetical protein
MKKSFFLLSFASLLGAASLLGNLADANAQTLNRVTSESTRVPLNTPVTILVEYTPQDPNWCGLTIDYGNGNKQSVRIGHEQDLSSPIKRTVSFSAVGTYVIKAEGTLLQRGLRTALPCRGTAQPFTITVFDLAAEKEKERAEAQAKAQIEAAEKARQDAERDRAKAEADAKARLEAERQARLKAEEAVRLAEEQKKALELRELELKRKELELREQALKREEASRRPSVDRSKQAVPPTPQENQAPSAPAQRPPVKAADGF